MIYDSYDRRRIKAIERFRRDLAERGVEGDELVKLFESEMSRLGFVAKQQMPGRHRSAYDKRQVNRPLTDKAARKLLRGKR